MSAEIQVKEDNSPAGFAFQSLSPEQIGRVRSFSVPHKEMENFSQQ